MEREDEILKKFAELSQEKLRNDTLDALLKMPEQELWNVMIQTRYRETQLLEQMKQIETEACRLDEMEAMLNEVFMDRLMINTKNLQINFTKEEDGEE